MFNFIFESGTFFVSVMFIVLVACTIFFPFLKRNELFGIRTKKSRTSEEVWHKIHVIAAILTIPFDILLIIILLIEDSFTQTFLGIIVISVVFAMYFIIQEIVFKNQSKNN